MGLWFIEIHLDLTWERWREWWESPASGRGMESVSRNGAVGPVRMGWAGVPMKIEGGCQY